MLVTILRNVVRYQLAAIGGTKMASRINAPWIRYGAMAAIFLVYFTLDSAAQQFVDPQVQSYPLQHVTAGQAERSLRDFLARQIESEPIDIVSDPQGDRILVRGSAEVQRSVAQFIPIIDRQSEVSPTHYAQATRDCEALPRYRRDGASAASDEAERSFRGSDGCSHRSR